MRYALASKLQRCLIVLPIGALMACGGSPQPETPEQQALAARSGGGGGGSGGADSATVDDGETAHLVFMREEEKLARDVYLTFAGWYPDYPVFVTIAEQAEQKHTDTVAAMLDKYGIADPNPETNDLPDSIGVFLGVDYGPYFTVKFGELTELGRQSSLSALYVGALIEELDMDDIINCPKEIVAQDNGIDEGECGMLYTDNNDIATMYSNLVDGSENHLKAFVRNIENIIGAGNYEAQYLTQEEVDEILDR